MHGEAQCSKILICAIHYEAKIVRNLSLIIGDFEPRCSYIPHPF